MSKPTEFEILRRKRRRVRALKKTVLSSVVLASIVLAVIATDRVYRWDMTSHIGNFVSSIKPGSGFPILMDGLDILQLLPMGKDVAVISSSGTYIYNKQGAHLACWMNNYNQPLCKSGGGKLLTYDLGGTRFRIDNKREKLFHKDTLGKILAADISQNGNVAIVTESRGHLAQVTAYNARCAEMYSWYTNACYIHEIALCGNMFVAAGLLVEGGQLITQLRIHHMNLDESDSEVAIVHLPEEVVLSLCWNERGIIQAITNQNVYLFDSYGVQQAQVSFSGELITYENRAQGGVILAFGDYREADGAQILVYNAQLERIAGTTIDKKILFIQSISRGRILILTQGRLYLADGHLRQVRARCVDNLYMMCGVGNHIYGITPDGLICTGL